MGHNLVAHDRPFIEAHLPGAEILDLPVVDTLYLAPLARPQRPYHPLVKDYKLVGGERSDPVSDCELALELLTDCWAILERRELEQPGLVSIYRTCFHDSDAPGGSSPLKLNGTGQLLEALGARMLPPDRVLRGFGHFARDKACPRAMARELPPLLADPMTRPAVAYSLAWLLVAGTESVLPRWVYRNFPAAPELLQAIRGTKCDDAECAYCCTQHDPRKKLRQYFEHPGFRAAPATTDGESLQERIVTRALARRPLLGILPTGGGKSLCFQLPAIMHNERTGALTVVLSPLQALMKDQVENLNRKTGGASLAAAVNGLLTMPERHDVLEGVRMGRFALLYVSPEQLRNRGFKNAIRQREIAAWVFDEAHCISKWGTISARITCTRPDSSGSLPRGKVSRRLRSHASPRQRSSTCARKSWRTSERNSGRNLRCWPPTVSTGAISTIPSRRWCRRRRRSVSANFWRSTSAAGQERPPPARQASPPPALRSSTLPGASKRSELAAALRRQGWKANHFHAGLDPPDKKRIQDTFIAGEVPVIVATNAFGMGIDKDNVRLVVHADVPGSIENYLQEAGRAGRDGKPAHCVLVVCQGRS